MEQKERQNRQKKKVTKCITIHGSIKRTFEEAQNFAYPLYINNSVMLSHLNSVRAPCFVPHSLLLWRT